MRTKRTVHWKTLFRSFLNRQKQSRWQHVLVSQVPSKISRQKLPTCPWSICADNIHHSFKIKEVLLLNDLEAIATAVPLLNKKDLVTLNQGVTEDHGTIAIIAPGTGLGAAFLIWTGTRYKACASEGGHTSFAPRNSQEINLLKFLQKRYSHVSFERICSGGQLPNIYDFFLQSGSYAEPEWLQKKMANTPDKTPVIVKVALQHQADICEATLDMFVHALGTVISNMAISLLPTGGIYLGGGIPPRILERLKRPDFMSSISDKGRFSDLCANMPIHVILSPNAALYGAAQYGIEVINSR